MPNLTTSSDVDAFMASANNAAARTNLGLTALATTTPGTGVATALGVNVGTAGSFVVNGGALGSPSSAGTIPAFTLGGTIAGGGNQLNNIVIGTATPLAGSFTTLSGSSTVTGLTFVPTGSSAPTNGMYLPAANTLGWAINSAAELQLTGTALSPAADGGSSLGTTALGWQNFFANTGFVLNIENSNWVATHTSGILTVGTGDLRVSTAGTNAASVVTVDGTQTLGNKTLTSPSITTSIVTGSTTLAVFNATATTVNAFGAATALNIGASAATVLNFGGFTSAAELRFLEPSGSGTNYIGFKAGAMAASTSYTLPLVAATAGQVLTAGATPTALEWATPASGSSLTSTFVGYGSGGNALTGEAAFAYNATTNTLTVDNVVSGVTTAALMNATTTTLNFAGAVTTLNLGLSAATVLNFGGFTSAAEFRFLEPSGSGTNYIGFKAGAMAASTSYTLPLVAATAGQVLTAGATPTALEWATPSSATAVTAASGAAGSGLLWVSAGADRTATATDTVTTINATTGNVTTLNLLENGGIVLDAALSADGKYCGIVEAGTAGATLAFGDVCYLAAADSRWELTDADAAATSGPVKIGICVLAAAGDGSATTMLLFGKIRADAAFPSFTISAPVFLSGTAGDVTNTAPTATDSVTRIVGYGNTADELFWCPDPTWITHT